MKVEKANLEKSAKTFWLKADTVEAVRAQVSERLPHLVQRVPIEETSMESGRGMVTPLHWAAENGHLDHVPTELLTVANMTIAGFAENRLLSSAAPYGDGSLLSWTPLDLAARYGHLDQIPRNILTAATLAERNCSDSPLHLAAEHGHLDQIPEKIFMNAPLPIPYRENRTLSAVTVAARNNRKEYTDPKWKAAIENDIMGRTNSSGNTFLHVAARHGHLDQVPEEFLLAGNLLVGNGGECALHFAAAHGYLNLVPREILTGENLLIEANNGGWTPLSSAVEAGQMDQLLGLMLPEEARDYVGDDWWEKNQKFIAEANKQKDKLADKEPEHTTIDIF